MQNEPDIVLTQIIERAASGGDIYEALHAFYVYLQKSLPMDRMSLVQFDFAHTIMRIIAQASDSGCEKTDFVFRFPGELLSLFQPENVAETYIMNDPEMDPIGKNIVERTGVADWSMLVMAVKGKAVTYGGIGFIAKGRSRYTAEHQRLITSLYKENKWFLDAIIKDRTKESAGPDQKEPVEDKYEFFRQVTRRLCGHLDLEAGALHCLQYLSRFMPAHMLSVHKYQKDPGEDFIGVSPTGFFNFFDPQRITRYTERLIPPDNTVTSRTVIINQPEVDSASNWSALAMYLFHKKVPLGIAFLTSEERNAYTEEHRHLFSMLHDPFTLALSNNIKHSEVIRLMSIIEQEKKDLQEELEDFRVDTIIGESMGLKGVMENARLVAGQDSPVLLSGETGSGKEIIANFIHQHSSRRGGPLIKVNCGGIPDTLIDSELFGHEKGAFTGAFSQKMGRFERANGGTIFLDEIAELPIQAQIRMLRVLQSKIIERVGGTDAIPVDIRIIAATHRNLEETVASGQFREDLWFRLNVFPIQIPPLRSRRSDIPALVTHFIEKKSLELNISAKPFLSSDALGRLIAYKWPGNVRELENVIERELILSKGELLTFQNIIPEPSNGNSQNNAALEDDVLEMDKVYARHIKNVLTLTKGKINGPGGAAELLKIKPGTLRNRMDKLGISYGWKKK